LDSGAGQCLIASAGAFQATTVRVCYITIEGVCGDLVKKRLVHHLHQASVAEVVFTDTFHQSDDAKHAYGKAFVCYRSRFGHVVCIKSRREVGKAFRRFCADVLFRPLILVRDNISEQKFGEMMDACVEMMVQGAFSTPYTPEEDYAEGCIGRACQLASFTML
jgi:hypothetical protein